MWAATRLKLIVDDHRPRVVVPPGRIEPSSALKSRPRHLTAAAPTRSLSRVCDDAVWAAGRTIFVLADGTLALLMSFVGSHVGSQCRQAPGDIRPH